ncbi:hypothetical protein [Streptomyces candidus]|uniref:Uncharacterized protein n=1 Tax=Streptomyces candidus TaxID=67283 RepID=A0A7X0LTW2_9ACTN|nr:hypothetical protein [Streptomyces candidus]MBB6439814.1 hypothetical protein [Streptomyces candidus]GHH57147.1 hypothetical protein GCM10018773_64090 [Streptomyces candidus]
MGSYRSSISACGGTPYVIVGGPSAEPDIIIGPGRRCTTPDGREYATTRGTGTWSAPGPESPVMVNGLYAVEAGTPARLLATLPALAGT